MSSKTKEKKTRIFLFVMLGDELFNRVDKNALNYEETKKNRE